MESDPNERAAELAKKLLKAASIFQAHKKQLVEEIVGVLEQLSTGTGSGCGLEVPTPKEERHPRRMNEWENARLEYFQKHALPQYIEHLKFRPLTFQIFFAGEAVLFTAWARMNHWAIAVVGLVGCVSALLWDMRTRHLMGYIHNWGRKMADPYFYLPENIADAIHEKLGRHEELSWRDRDWWIRHTVALTILIIAVGVVWAGILLWHFICGGGMRARGQSNFKKHTTRVVCFSEDLNPDPRKTCLSQNWRLLEFPRECQRYSTSIQS